MRVITISIFLIMFLTGCNSGPLPEEQIYVHLEQAVKLETEFEEQQEPMTNLEQKEKELYNQIIELGLKELEQIKQLSAEAIQTVDDRKEMLDQEYESIKQSKAEFDKINEIVTQIEDEELKSESDALIQTMEERYQAYEELYAAYSTSISLDKELYEMFQVEDLTMEALEGKINEINKSYEQVIQLNESFNTITTNYNNQKKSFYETAGLEVTYETD
jgi:DNA repair exonuclease SbcCD ATPase subunit